MIIGIGTDIIQVRRIIPFLDNQSMCDKIYTKKEQEYFLKHGRRYEAAAGMWAAKESYMKASGDMSKPMNEIEIIHEDDGQPHIHLHDVPRPLGYRIRVSISHDGEYAIAFITMENAI